MTTHQDFITELNHLRKGLRICAFIAHIAKGLVLLNVVGLGFILFFTNWSTASLGFAVLIFVGSLVVINYSTLTAMKLVYSLFPKLKKLGCTL